MAVTRRRGAVHVIPDGESDRHTAGPACPCGPFQQSVFDGDCRIRWLWVHEPRKRARAPEECA